MPDLPAKKVGLIACSGEEMPEGTMARLATLRVLQQLKPGETVTICLPLFLAGGEGDRAFARFYPTIAVDGCEKRCAFNGTQKYSNTPAAGFVIRDLLGEVKGHPLGSARRLNDAGQNIVEKAADQIASKVDEILDQSWNRSAGNFKKEEDRVIREVTCSCGSGIPASTVTIKGEQREIVALPVILRNFREQNKQPSQATLTEILEMVNVYNEIKPEEKSEYLHLIEKEYLSLWNTPEGTK